MATDTFELLDADGNSLPGYLATDAAPAVVLLHEVLGLNEQMRGTARKMAGEGVSVFALDLFDGKTTGDTAVGFKLAQRMHWMSAIERVRRARQALADLGAGARVGVVGFGLGGALALAAASYIPELAACVPFYGIPTPDRADLSRIGCKVQAHFAREDKLISLSRVDELAEALTGFGVTNEVHRYQAQHGFMNEVRKATFSPYNSQHAWHRMMAFLKRELG
jgi:carboxymethylenebutenolidase